MVPGPGEGWVYEPKYDGWRGCLHADPGRLHSRSGTELSGRFPELLAAAAELALDEAVLDGELVAVRGDAARLEFAALQASPRRRRAEGVVVYFLVFDLLAQHGHDLRSYPYVQRRAALEALLPGRQSRLQPVPTTTDRAAALEWLDPAYGTVGIEGVVAKPTGPYRRGRASNWRKTRHTVTTEAVVAGVSTGASGQHSLVLAVPTATGRWHAVGLSQPLPDAAQRALAGQLDYLGGLTARLPGIVAGLPGQQQIDYDPVAPSVVVEIETDAVGEYGRLRHRPRYVRTRPDRGPSDLPGPGWNAGGRTTFA